MSTEVQKDSASNMCAAPPVSCKSTGDQFVSCDGTGAYRCSLSSFRKVLVVKGGVTQQRVFCGRYGNGRSCRLPGIHFRCWAGGDRQVQVVRQLLLERHEHEGRLESGIQVGWAIGGRRICSPAELKAFRGKDFLGRAPVARTADPSWGVENLNGEAKATVQRQYSGGCLI